MKMVYSDPKSGKSAQLILEGDRQALLFNRKINDVVEGALIGLSGFKLKITGGSDKSGFPLTKGIIGSLKTTVLKTGARSGRHKGEYRRMTVRGDTITQDTEQVNAIIVEYGEKPVAELFPEKAGGEKKEEKPEKKEEKPK